MYKSLKTFFPLGLLAAFALSGCGGQHADQTAAAQPSANQRQLRPVANQQPIEMTADSTDAGQPAGKKLTARDRMEQMKEQMQRAIQTRSAWAGSGRKLRQFPGNIDCNYR